MTSVPPESEYAPQYGTAAKWRRVGFGAAVVAAVWACERVWFGPWLDDFAQRAHCERVLGMNGAAAMLYALFVGTPLLMGAIYAASVARVGVRAIRTGALPPPGVRVIRRTRVVRGTPARVRGALLVASTLTFPVLAGWGWWQAHALATGAEASAARPGVKAKCAPGIAAARAAAWARAGSLAGVDPTAPTSPD